MPEPAEPEPPEPGATEAVTAAPAPRTARTVAPAPRRSGRHAVVIAHRGASAHHPENTLPAFMAAWDGGAQWVEADTQPTADGVPVLLHDADLDRTTSGSGPVRGLDVDAVTSVDAGAWFHGIDPAGTRTGVLVPRLSELLALLLTQDRKVLLEIKGEHTAEQIDAVVRACRASGRDGNVFLQSFETTALRLLRHVEPRRSTGLLVEGVDDDPVGRCREVGAVACNPDYRALLDRPGIVGRLHAAGLSVSVWTADDPADWAALTRAGVDGIITNTPVELLCWQASAGH